MNKEAIKTLVDSLGLPVGEYSILSSGSLVLRGIIEYANDLDLHVTKHCFEYIAAHFKIHFKDKEHAFCNPLYAFDELDVDFFVMPEEEMFFDMIEGYPCQCIAPILAYKKERMAPKDIPMIEKIEAYQSRCENT